MKAPVTRYDEELLERARIFLKAAEENPQARVFLERYGFLEAEQERGRSLVRDTERSFEWERQGTSWNFLSPTPERRAAEARHWYKDARRRYLRECLRRAEEESGWVGWGSASRWPLRRKATGGLLIVLRQLRRAGSFDAYRRHRAELRANLARARSEKPAGAPPPKDSMLVELSGWYEHWRLLAQRVFRERPDLLAPFGLRPGKAPPRLRGRSARIKYGEGAAGSLPDPGGLVTIRHGRPDEHG